MGVLKPGAALVLALMATVQSEPRDERLYGRVTTAGGDVLEGYLRWDRNEASWADVLDGLKEIPWENLREAEELDPELAERGRRERSIEAFGVRITWDRDDTGGARLVPAGVRFGLVESLVVVDERRARLRLRGGDEVVLGSSSTDLGRSMRPLVVDDARRGQLELRWRDVDRVDFFPAPAEVPDPSEERLHGTLTTRGGAELTGFVAWDLDEVFTSDELDGDELEGRRERVIPFADIAAIEYESERSARVVLRDGGELVLRGTNDVDRDNRGIEISDPGFGRAIVEWGELDALVLHERLAAPAGYEDFAPAGRLFGTVFLASGAEVTGSIRWDNDEEAAWELLDGWSDGVDYDVELGRVAAVDRTRDGARVTLLDGRVFELEGTDDVGPGNEGIFVTPDGAGPRLVRWDDLERVVFRR